MSIRAEAGPHIVFGTSGGPGEYNPQIAPNLAINGDALLDPRAFYTYQPGQGDSSPVAGWLMGAGYVVIDAVPAAATTTNIVAVQAPGSGAIALVSTSGAGITTGVSFTRADTGVVVTGAIAIDYSSSVPARVNFGQVGTVQVWNPAFALARVLRYTSSSNDSGITFTTNGFDIYGYPMTETVTGGNATVANGSKAFKYITSITHTGTVAANISVGTVDTFGLPLRQDTFPYSTIFWNNTVATGVTGFTAAVTSVATATTGDVRGTYAVQGASANASLRLVVFQSVSPSNMAAGQSGVIGVNQF